MGRSWAAASDAIAVAKSARRADISTAYYGAARRSTCGPAPFRRLSGASCGALCCAAMLALSTDCLPLPPAERLARLLGLSPDGLALGAEADLRDALTMELSRARVPMAALFLPGGPRLCAPDRDERREAVARAERELDRANRLEAGHAVVDPGALDPGLGPAWRALLDAFARGTPEGAARSEFLAARRRRRDAHLDGLRHSLDALLPPAERRGTVLGLLPAGAGDSLGFPEEIGALMADYAGAPLSPWRATDREHRLLALGLVARGTEVAASGATLADAVGALGGLPPGLGEVDWPAALAGVAPAAPRVLSCERATEDELRRALAFLRGPVPTGP
jgi:sugar phosphate isomerase/epimerase